jgi:predicted esterase
LKAGDTIVDMDGHPVVRMAQILHILGTKYEGDKISLKFQRGKETIAVADLELVGKTTAYAHPYLGILPLRDDPRLGVEIRHVYPKSPADRAGLKEGDRIVKIGAGMTPLKSFTGNKRGSVELADILNTHSPGTELKLEVVRKDKKTETVTVTLEQMPGTTTQEDRVPDKLPELASHKKALEPLEVPNAKAPKIDPGEKTKPETGLLERKVTNGKFWVYVHEDYDPNVAHALLVWLHPAGKYKKDDVEEFVDLWADYCEENNLILLCPVSDNEAGWVPSDADFVAESIKDVLGRYTIDRERVVTHGMGVGGQMAVYLGFNARDLVRGVVTSGAVVGQPKDNLPNQRLAFYVSGGDRDPLIKEIAEGRDKLIERRFPVIYREIANRGREYFQDPVIHEVVRWIDSLDRR